MIQQQLSSVWTFWSYYSTFSKDKGPQNQEDYHKNLVKVLSLTTLQELAYLLDKCKLASLDNFFTNIDNMKVIKFAVQREDPKQIDVISMFRDDIEPTWQYGDNIDGGQFTAAVRRDGSHDVNKIYGSLLIALAGDFFPFSEDIIGVRFVEKTNFGKGDFTVKVQIWTSYNSDSANKITDFSKALNEFANQVGWTLDRFQFKNNRK